MPIPYSLARRRLAGAAVGSAAGRSSGLPGAGFEVISASTRLEGGVYRLSAQIEYRFSNPALEALQNGVPLTVELEMEVRRRRPGCGMKRSTPWRSASGWNITPSAGNIW
jgi:hypothetical protein